MITSEEKLQFIQKIPLESQNAEKTQAQLRELLLGDTNGGKLYKYRAVSNRSIECLENGTMYCSFPGGFNDPYDCKIGYSFQSLYEAKFETELDAMEAILSDYVQVLLGRITLNDCAETERRTIEKLLSNKNLTEFFNRTNGIAKTPEQESELLRRNFSVIQDLLLPVLEGKMDDVSFGIISDILSKATENIAKNGALQLSEEDFSFDDFARANGVTDDTDEIGKILPLMMKLAPDKEQEAINVQRVLKNGEDTVSEKMLNLFRIGCLATDCKNRLMWSHYSDSHKGFCIEYDFSGTDTYTMEHLPLPIYYSAKRPLFPWKASIQNTPKNIAEASAQIMTGLLTKDKAWEYENEWRILISGSSEPLLKMPPISCIYLGAAMKNHNRKRIISISKRKGISVKQMVIDRGTFDLHAQEIL